MDGLAGKVKGGRGSFGKVADGRTLFVRVRPGNSTVNDGNRGSGLFV